MRKTVERLAYGLVVFTAALLWMALRAGALAEPGLNALLPTNQGSVRLSVIPDDQVDEGLGDGYWLFLPAFADRETLVLQREGQEIRLDWTSAHDEAEGVQCLELPGGDRLHVMQSENLRALFLFSDDPVQQGRAWLEDCGKHERHTTGSLLLVAANGNVSHDERIKKLRGRGNGTWNALKKPYQIKLANKVDLLDRNELTEQKRTWVLLAMSTDPSLLRDRMALDMGLEMGLTETSGSEYVDLYYDGEYRVTYLLCEKVEIGKGRIQETDYGELVEEWNEALGLDEDEMETLPEGVGENAYGLEYHWVEGVQTPGEVSEGTYLLEMEPLVKETLLGGGKGKQLQSLDAYVSQMGASRRMNERLLQPDQQDQRFIYAHDVQEDT